MTEPSELAELVAALRDAFREQDELLFDEEYEHKLGAACTASSIDAVEQRLRRRLPPSYRAFLMRHDGWTRFTGDAVVLSCADFFADWVRRRVAALSALFFERGPDPFERGAFPLVLGEDARTFLVADPTTVRDDGEMDLILYDLTRESRRFPDFVAFLRYKLEVVRAIIESERNGSDGNE
jgi:hypothetical protein